MDENGEREPWERLPAETPKAYAAFCLYRDSIAVNRSIRKTCQEALKQDYAGTRLRVWERWSSRYHWVSRAEAYDEYKERETRIADLDAYRRMREKHITEATALQAVAQKGLKKLLEGLNTDKRDMSPGMILQFLTQGAAMERVARGEPGAIVIEDVDNGDLEIKVVWNGPPRDDSPDAVDAPGTDGGIEQQGPVPGAGVRPAVGQDAAGGVPVPG